MDALHRLFAPDTVAVVGATDRENSVGRAIVENLLDTFDGSVIPVNPRRSSVLGRECVTSLADAGSVDLAVVVVPPDAVIETAREAGELGITTLVVITAGFGEAGQTGAERSQELAGVIEKYDLTVVGPNSLGVISTEHGLNASFSHLMPDAGPISFLSQSGAFVTAVLDWAHDQAIGFRHVVSLGNKLDVDEAALLEAWNDDPETEVIIGYIESIEAGRRFMETAREVTSDTPVALIKSGRTEAGAQAASSHTGAMAGSDRVVDAAFAQSGVLRSTSAIDLFDAAAVLAGQPPPAEGGLAIVSNAGGPAVMATDATDDAALDLARFDDETVAALREQLPPAADPYNPIDILGDADVDRFRTALETVVADPNVTAVLVLSAPVAVIDYPALAEAVTEVHAANVLPFVACFMGGRERTEPARRQLDRRSIPNYFDPARAVGAMANLETYRIRQEQPPLVPDDRDLDTDRIESILDEARSRGEATLGLEAMELFDAIGIDTPAGELVSNPEAASEVAESLPSDRVVMKVVSPDVSHKTDFGGVALNVDPTAVATTYESIVTNIRRYQPDASVLGVYVQEMLDLDNAVEVIVGANQDPQFGSVVLFGLGGIFVEILEDVTVRVTPLDESTATAMLEDIDAAPLLTGARGREPVDRSALVDAILAIGALVDAYPEILELDINPLVATPDGAQAIDIRCTLDTN